MEQKGEAFRATLRQRPVVRLSSAWRLVQRSSVHDRRALPARQTADQHRYRMPASVNTSKSKGGETRPSTHIGSRLARTAAHLVLGGMRSNVRIAPATG